MRRDFSPVCNDITSKVFDILITDLEKRTADENNNINANNLLNNKGIDDTKTENSTSNLLEKELNSQKEKKLHQSDTSKSHFAKNADNKFVKNNGNPLLIKRLVDVMIDYKQNIETLPLEKFIINTMFKKDPDSYNHTQHLPHIALAQRLQKKNIIYKKGDIISYVIGQGKKSEPLNQRTFLPSENFFLDYNYYIENQILSCLHRLLTIFEGISAEDINKIFGIVKNVQEIPKTKIKICTPCCQVIQDPTQQCSKCNNNIDSTFYVYKMYDMLRKEVRKIYCTQYICTECGYKTNSHSHICVNCFLPMKEELLNFEFDEFLASLAESFREIEECRNIVDGFMKRSIYRKIDLTRYFTKEILRYVDSKNLF
ncbi:hypothetical protein EDEG_00036 [Edhazardia aedis USNM 41457]|uniref:DNA-directed DNA polymerase n=1 Tax=Edhazardia aedis (strain USNM 41457) TaxID=1003232 RepID=J9DJ86_EDHAE|nr:hypothetical protein EDEG_00036 [Edhazardia aedis USNM 41457]|eukprot:EJW01442.1 hypothetical protein EDEG_00036 [Edhazardia aedis USNM 41457]